MDQIIKDMDSFLKEINYVSPWIYFDSISWDEFNNIQAVSLKKNSIVFSQNEMNTHAFIVKSGRLRVFYTDNNGNENCIYIAEKGSLIGEASIIDNQPNFYSAITIVDSELYKIPKNDFLYSIRSNTDLNDKILKNLIRKLRALSSEIEFFSKNSQTRVAISLLSLAVRYGKRHGENIMISIKFTHEELGFLTSLNRVTVSNIYSYLFKNNIITKIDGYIVLLDINALKNMVTF